MKSSNGRSKIGMIMLVNVVNLQIRSTISRHRPKAKSNGKVSLEEKCANKGWGYNFFK